MQLTPRYDGTPFLRIELPLDDAGELVVQQRRRLAALLTGFHDQQWAAASRCEGWSVQDVIAHLVGTNQYWAFSVAGALAGEPTRFMATFDPVASPAALVEDVRSQSAATVLDRFRATNEALAEVLGGLEGDAWSLLGEAPPGHVPLRAVLLHALWDSWVHERDIVLPLGLPPVEEPDEIAACLAYSAALGPALAAGAEMPPEGTVVVEASHPDLRFVVEVGRSVVVHVGDAPASAPCLTGPALALVEALSLRAPFPFATSAEHQRLLGGLAEVFDRSR